MSEHHEQERIRLLTRLRQTQRELSRLEQELARLEQAEAPPPPPGSQSPTTPLPIAAG